MKRRVKGCASLSPEGHPVSRASVSPSAHGTSLHPIAVVETEHIAFAGIVV